MYAELIELIQTDSPSGEENAMFDVLKGKLETLGFSISTDHAGDSFGGKCGNLFAVREGELPGSLMLCSHMDRMPNGRGIKPVEKNGILYSDGTTILAADDVSGLTVILAGVREILASGRPLPRLEVLFTVGEEAGLHGARGMDFSKLQSRIGYIFDSPGPVGRFVTAAPGRYALKAEVTGLSAHAGNEPEKGIDAAKVVCQILATLETGRLDPITTSNFPILSTNTKATNAVCDFASFSGEARSRDIQRLNDYVAYFKDHCASVAAAAGATVKTEASGSFLPFVVPEDAQVCRIAAEACAALNLSPRFEPGGGAMDANIFNAVGITCIGVATGYTKNHTVAEQLVLDDFFRAGDLCVKLIGTYADSCVSK